MFENVGDCWKCTSHKSAKGYPRGKGGQLIVKRNWIAKNGIWPSGKVARHLCAHAWCINPDHIAPGSQFENIVDTVLDGERKGKKYFHGMLTRALKENVIYVNDDGYVVRTIDNKIYMIHAKIELIVQGTFQRLPHNKKLMKSMIARGESLQTRGTSE